MNTSGATSSFIATPAAIRPGLAEIALRSSPAPTHISVTPSAPRPMIVSTSITEGGSSTPDRFTASPSTHAISSGLPIRLRATPRQLGFCPSPQREWTVTVITFTTGMPGPISSATSAEPSGPNAAAAAARITNVFHRIDPWCALANVGPRANGHSANPSTPIATKESTPAIANETSSNDRSARTISVNMNTGARIM
jgi:hypothetical protein